jgi:hypothetical protein
MLHYIIIYAYDIASLHKPKQDKIRVLKKYGYDKNTT